MIGNLLKIARKVSEAKREKVAIQSYRWPIYSFFGVTISSTQ